MARLTLLEKQTKMLEALKCPSVSNQRLLAKKLGIATPTINSWLADSVPAQIKLSENKKAARFNKVKKAVAETKAMIANGVPGYRAAALAGVSYDTYIAYKRELTGQSC